jgi:hypothetical protein
VTGVLKFLEVSLVNFRALALQIRSEISSDMGAFIPIEFEPAQSFVNRGSCFLGVARFVRVFDAQNKFAAMMSGEKPVKECGTGPADVEITGR